MARSADQFEQLTAYLDGELPPAERAEVEAWIARDPEARRLFDELRRTSDYISRLPRESVAPDFTDAVVARLEREALVGASDDKQPRVNGGGAWRPLALAASLLLVVTAGWFAWPHVNARIGRVVEPVAMRESAPDLTRTEEDTLVALGYADADSPAPAGLRERTVNGREMFATRTETASPVHAPADEDDMRMGVAMQPQPAPASPDSDAGAEALARSIVAAPAEGALADAESLDEQLARGDLTNFDVQNASPDAFLNRVTVEIDDPAAVPALVAHLEREMGVNHIRSLESIPQEAPVTQAQPFYNVCVDPRAGPRARSTSAPTPEDEVLLVVNVDTRMVQPLIHSLKACTEQKQVRAQWDFNGQRLRDEGIASQVRENLITVPPPDETAMRQTMSLGQLQDQSQQVWAEPTVGRAAESTSSSDHRGGSATANQAQSLEDESNDADAPAPAGEEAKTETDAAESAQATESPPTAGGQAGRGSTQREESAPAQSGGRDDARPADAEQRVNARPAQSGSHEEPPPGRRDQAQPPAQSGYGGRGFKEDPKDASQPDDTARAKKGQPADIPSADPGSGDRWHIQQNPRFRGRVEPTSPYTPARSARSDEGTGCVTLAIQIRANPSLRSQQSQPASATPQAPSPEPQASSPQASSRPATTSAPSTPSQRENSDAP